MALKIGQEAHKPSKICIREAVEYEPMKWRPTGCCMYIDRDAPLDSLPGWQKALVVGECVISQQLFKQIRKIVEDSLKKMEQEA